MSNLDRYMSIMSFVLLRNTITDVDILALVCAGNICKTSYAHYII